MLALVVTPGSGVEEGGGEGEGDGCAPWCKCNRRGPLLSSRWGGREAGGLRTAENSAENWEEKKAWFDLVWSTFKLKMGVLSELCLV